MLAKICSDFNKPNGQYELENDREKIFAFLKDLPIRKVCFFEVLKRKKIQVSGIGGVSEAHLKAAGISTVGGKNIFFFICQVLGDLWTRRAILPAIFSPNSTESFLRTSMGLPHKPSASDDHRRKVSSHFFNPGNLEFVVLF